MGIMCWLFGHRELETFKGIDFAFTQIVDMICDKKSVGTMHITYKTSICKRCQVLYNSKIITKRNLK